jgi:single-strand DNA-binding protein
MIRLEIVGNLGADAEIKEYNGNKFVSFRVAHSEKWVDHKTGAISTQTTWVSCSLNGNGKGLTQYLKKGTKVFLRGTPNFVQYSSPKTHKMEVGVNLFVKEIELCGGLLEQSQDNSGNVIEHPELNGVKPF